MLHEISNSSFSHVYVLRWFIACALRICGALATVAVCEVGDEKDSGSESSPTLPASVFCAREDEEEDEVELGAVSRIPSGQLTMG
jgi:hypothetical protein